jgi:hypothetical protein
MRRKYVNVRGIGVLVGCTNLESVFVMQRTPEVCGGLRGLRGLISVAVCMEGRADDEAKAAFPCGKWWLMSSRYR